MNIHHLELFYYVAKHGGIAAAVRNMPYGIQQPAVSGQIARLEEALGAKLFNRRPFSLLPAGVELFEFIKPFFDDVEKVAGRIRGAVQQLRIAALRSCCTIMFPNYYSGCADVFPSSGSNFTRQHEATPRDCCRQEKSIWRLR
jgi:DNA-binding transcriptional LysR family regulator